MGLAGRAFAAETAGGETGGGSAIGAEAVAGMPGQDRFRRGEKAELVRRHRVLGGEATQVGGAEAGIGLVPVGGLRRDRAGEDRSAVEAAEEQREIGVAGARRLPGGEERRIAGKDDAVPATSTIRASGASGFGTRSLLSAEWRTSRLSA